MLVSLYHYYNFKKIIKHLTRAISRSPIFSQFSETLTGSSSIRAYSCVDRMVAKNETLLNNNNRAYFTSQAMNQWYLIFIII